MRIKEWIKKTLIKTVKTMAQTASGMITAGVVITDVNWKYVGSAALVSGIVCILMNISEFEES